MPPVLKIKFDENDHRVYYSGETLSGWIEISCSKPVQIRSVAIYLLGYGKTFWDNTCKLNCIKRNHSAYYDNSGREEYISKHIIILGSPTATPNELSQGLHRYEFSFTLPLTLPSSFEGSNGHIRYLAKATLDKPFASIQSCMEQFTVVNTFDLNNDSPVLKLRADVETFYEAGCLCCISKPFRLKASVPQTGLVPGEIIPIRTEIINACNIRVLDVRFFLRKIITYSSNKHTVRTNKKEVHELVSLSSGYMVRKGCNKFEEYLAVPKTHSTTREVHSSIIQIDYDIKVEVVVHIWHKNPMVLCPITIGTIPLKEIVQNEYRVEKKKFGDNDLQPLNGRAFQKENGSELFIQFIDE